METQARKNTALAQKREDKELKSSKGNGMTNGSPSEKTLKHLFREGLLDILSAENQLLKALPEMAKAAYSEDLEDTFNEHLRQTKKHVERLEKIFSRLNIKPEGKKCEAMEGLIAEGKKVIKYYNQSPVRDAALIISAQKVEHYEIASYGSLRELAEVMGWHKIADILDRTLEEEEDTDRYLTELALDVNDEALEMTEDMTF